METDFKTASINARNVAHWPLCLLSNGETAHHRAIRNPLSSPMAHGKGLAVRCVDRYQQPRYWSKGELIFLGLGTE